MRKFKCIGLEEPAGGVRNWAKYFTIGKIYNFEDENDGICIYLTDNEGDILGVNPSQFEEVKEDDDATT